MTAPSATTTSTVGDALRRFWPFELSHIDVSDRDNNFYAIRLALAARVIFGHAFVLGGVSVEAGHSTFGALYNSLGVNGFFVVSGFLVTRSLISSRSLAEYTAARVLRILPALWAMLLITVPLVLLFGTDAASRGSPETWSSALSYLARNLSVGLVSYTIPGVFETLQNGAVNGSIWSLRFEVFCYVILALAGLVGMVRRRIYMLIFATVLSVLFLAYAQDPSVSFFARRFVRLGSLFFVGSAMALYADKLVVNTWLALAGTLLAAAVGYAIGLTDIVYLAFGYLLISLAYSKARVFRTLTRWLQLKGLGKPDLSYGIFLYSFPIQQLLYYNEVTPGPVWNILATIVLATLCAYLSSEFIEKPAARLRPQVLALLGSRFMAKPQGSAE